MTTWLYLISSAALYAASVLGVEYFWWGAFFFLIPLFCLVQYKKLTFFHGFIWGVVTYSLQISAIWLLSIEYGEGCFRFFAPGLVVCWFALFSGLWFVALNVRSILTRFVITISFFLFINFAVLTPFSCALEGYPFALPLVPLTYGAKLGLLPILGKTGLLAGLILIQLAAAHKYFFWSVCLTVGLFFSVPIHEQQGDWKKQCIGVSHAWSEQTPYERAQEICHVLIDTAQKYPDKRVIILPESVFPWPLREHQYALRMWADNALNNDQYLILGSYRKNNGKLLNTFYNVYQGRIIFYYDKTHLIPYFERKNPFKFFNIGNTLFLSSKEGFTPGTSHTTFNFSHGSEPLTPLVCSETFWCMPSQKKAIALINDSYFSLSYFPKLMRLLAQMNALEQQTALFYCSWRSNS